MQNNNQGTTIELADFHCEYLEALRDSGVTNMFGAGRYLEEEFGYTRKQAREVLLAWFETFNTN